MKNVASWIRRHVTLVTTDVSEDVIASIVIVEIITRLGTRLAITSNYC
jgi:hypothetical protein